MNIWEILIESGLILTGIFFIVKWGADILAGKIKEGWRIENEKDLESLKSDLSRNNEVLISAINNLSANNQIAQSERIKAVKETWNTIIEIRDFISPAITFFEINLPKEYSTHIHHDIFQVGLEKITDEKITSFINENDNVAKLRPFIGDKTWVYFYTYRQICFRATYILTRIQDGDFEDEWYNDSGMKQFLESIFSSNELQEIKNQKVYSLRTALNLLEQKILQELNTILSGRKNIKETFKYSQKLTELTSIELNPRNN